MTTDGKGSALSFASTPLDFEIVPLCLSFYTRYPLVAIREHKQRVCMLAKGGSVKLVERDVDSEWKLDDLDVSWFIIPYEVCSCGL